MVLQEKKVYVQDRLRQEGDLVWELLQQQGHVYVCGDASAMAPTVEKTLIEIFQEHLVGTRRLVSWPCSTCYHLPVQDI